MTLRNLKGKTLIIYFSLMLFITFFSKTLFYHINPKVDVSKPLEKTISVTIELKDEDLSLDADGNLYFDDTVIAEDTDDNDIFCRVTCSKADNIDVSVCTLERKNGSCYIVNSKQISYIEYDNILVELIIGTKKRLFIEEASVIDGKYVYIVYDEVNYFGLKHRVKKIPVKLGISEDRFVEVTDGINPEDLVVTKCDRNIQDGDIVVLSLD
ncbi:MAG TPA: hypothetical protein PK830_08365 [Candidatus Atribacteria bacterium]|nr:hypothetical protein [Candidatus Atribacteria bacterium]